MKKVTQELNKGHPLFILYKKLSNRLIQRLFDTYQTAVRQLLGKLLLFTTVYVLRGEIITNWSDLIHQFNEKRFARNSRSKTKACSIFVIETPFRFSMYLFPFRLVFRRLGLFFISTTLVLVFIPQPLTPTPPSLLVTVLIVVNVYISPKSLSPLS